MDREGLQDRDTLISPRWYSIEASYSVITTAIVPNSRTTLLSARWNPVLSNQTPTTLRAVPYTVKINVSTTLAWVLGFKIVALLKGDHTRTWHDPNCSRTARMARYQADRSGLSYARTFLRQKKMSTRKDLRGHYPPCPLC